MDDRDKILLAAIFAFVLMTWGSAWAFTRVNGYPAQWYWLPGAVTSIVALFFAHAWFFRSPSKQENSHGA